MVERLKWSTDTAWEIDLAWIDWVVEGNVGVVVCKDIGGPQVSPDLKHAGGRPIATYKKKKKNARLKVASNRQKYVYLHFPAPEWRAKMTKVLFARNVQQCERLEDDGVDVVWVGQWMKKYK